MQMTQEQQERWVSLGDAMKECGISAPKLHGLIKEFGLDTKQSVRDRRVTRIDVNQLRRVLEMPPVQE
jgi:hypothetical protein